MKIYNYHPITKEYIGESIADKSPLEEGIFHIPANATEIQPLETNKNEVAIFENENWIVKPDFRDKKGWNLETRQEIIITEIGELPLIFSETKPEKTQEEIQEELDNQKQINNENIQKQINEINLESVDEIRKILLEMGKKGKDNKLETLENQAISLKSQLKE